MLGKSESISSKSNPGRLSALDSIRGIAALLLVVGHVASCRDHKLENIGDMERLVRFFWCGVPLFYALSAFSLMIGYATKLQAEDGLLHFFIRRVFRILPLFYAVLVLMLVLNEFVFALNTGFNSMLINYLCVFGLIPGQHEGIVWASWSIGVEVLFYAIFPLALLASRSLGSSLLVFLATLCISLSSQQLLVGFKEIAPNFSYRAFSTQIVFFGAGLFAFRLGEFLSNSTRKFPGFSKKIFAESLFLAGVGLFLLYSLGPLSSWAAKVNLLYQTLAFILILILSPPLIHGRLKTLAFRPLERAGTISFSLYLINPLVILFLSKKGIYEIIYSKINQPNLAFICCILLTLAILWPLCEATYFFIEEKGIRLGDNILRFMQTGGQSAGPGYKPTSRFRVSTIALGFFALPWLAWGGLAILDKPTTPNLLQRLYDLNSSSRLHSLILKKELSKPNREPKISANGLYVAAGTKLGFSVKDKFALIRLDANLIKLPSSVPVDGGIVGVDVLVDGRSQGRKVVDRKTNQAWSMDLTGANELAITVDNANGTDLWDWVEIRILENKHSLP